MQISQYVNHFATNCKRTSQTCYVDIVAVSAKTPGHDHPMCRQRLRQLLLLPHTPKGAADLQAYVHNECRCLHHHHTPSLILTTPAPPSHTLTTPQTANVPTCRLIATMSSVVSPRPPASSDKPTPTHPERYLSHLQADANSSVVSTSLPPPHTHHPTPPHPQAQTRHSESVCLTCRLMSTMSSVVSLRSLNEGCFLASSRYAAWYLRASRRRNAFVHVNVTYLALVAGPAIPTGCEHVGRTHRGSDCRTHPWASTLCTVVCGALAGALVFRLACWATLVLFSLSAPAAPPRMLQQHLPLLTTTHHVEESTPATPYHNICGCRQGTRTCHRPFRNYHTNCIASCLLQDNLQPVCSATASAFPTGCSYTLLTARTQQLVAVWR